MLILPPCRVDIKVPADGFLRRNSRIWWLKQVTAFLLKWIVTPRCFYFLSNWMKIPKAAWSDTSWVSWHQLLKSETRRSNITNASLINISHIFQPLWSSNFYDATLQQTTSCIIIRNQNHGSIVFFWSHCFKTRISDISRTFGGQLYRKVLWI